MYSLGRKGVVPNRFVDTLARGPGGSGQTSGGRDFRPDAHPLMDVLGRRDVHISSPPAEPRRTPEMYAFLLSTVVIFVAELGDKSQLMAMTFATRYRARDVILGITAATAIVHLSSVGIGVAIGSSFADYQDWISIVAGVAFLVFAGWTLRGDELTDEEAQKAKNSKGLAILAVGAAFFLAELGDKTMLATIILAIGRASGRERVCQHGQISGVAVPLNKNKTNKDKKTR